MIRAPALLPNRLVIASLVLVGALLATVVCAENALADEPSEPAAEPTSKPTSEARVKASARFQKGVELYNAGDIRAALIEFNRAYDLAPTYHLLYNIGQAAAVLRDYVAAHESFTRYLQDGGNVIDAKRVAEVEREIARLKTYLARVRLTVSTAGAEVSVDGVIVGVTPVEPLVVSAGRRHIVITHKGFARWERFIDLAGEDDQAVEADLVSLAPIQPAGPAIGRGDSGGMGAAFWASAAITGVFAIGTGVAAGLTVRAEGDFEDELMRIPTTQQAIDDKAKKVKRFALATDIGIGLTVAGLLTTIVLAVRGGGSSSEAPSESVGVVLGPSGLALTGSF